MDFALVTILKSLYHTIQTKILFVVSCRLVVLVFYPRRNIVFHVD